MYIDENSIKDCNEFILKLIKALTDEQLRGVLHTHYSEFSDIEREIKQELGLRGMSTKKEFNSEGDWKY